MKITVYKADWCPHCQELMKSLEELKKVFDLDIEIIDIEENPELAENITEIPKIFVDGEEITFQELINKLHSQI